MNRLLKYIDPTDSKLFFSRNDPNDIRLGDIVMHDDFSKYENANVIIIGCPQDEGVRRNKGRIGARAAPTEIRRSLYRYPVSDSHRHLKLYDLGNIKIENSLEEIHDILFTVVRQIIKDGKKIIILGGGNDISYPDCSALSSVTDRLLVLNIDRHLDVRANNQRNSGTPYRQLLEEQIILPDLFYEVGINSFANSSQYLTYVEELGVHVYYLGDLRENGVGATLRSITKNTPADAIFFGFDLDVVRAVEAPGVSDTGPMGLTAREVCEIADVAAEDSRTRIIEITEVNPTYDINGITSKLAANIIMRSLAEGTR